MGMKATEVRNRSMRTMESRERDENNPWTLVSTIKIVIQTITLLYKKIEIKKKERTYCFNVGLCFYRFLGEGSVSICTTSNFYKFANQV